jgi:hypothetical protein
MNSHETHLERTISLIPLPYYWAGTFAGEVLFLISVIILTFFEKSFEYIISFFILSTLIALQIVFVAWAHEKIRYLRDIFIDMIELPREEILKWYEGQEANIFNNKMMVLTGVSITVFAHLLGLDNFGFHPKSYYVLIFIKFYYFLAHYVMGASLYTLIATAFMVYKMGKLPLRVSVLLSKNIQFKGVLYSKFTLCAACVYLIWGFFHMSTPSGLSTLQSKLWFSSFAVLLCAYFILPQYSLHQMMIETKKEKLGMFSSRLKDKAEEAIRNPTKENASILKNMLDIQCQLDEMCKWPFGYYEILHIVLIVIIPLIVVALEIKFGVIK